MKRKLAAIAACVILGAGSVGCRMCSDACDYSPPLAGSSYSNPYGRAGSAFTGPLAGAAAPLPAAQDDEPPAEEGAAATADPQTAITASALGWSE